MTRPFIVMGDKTSHGGTVITADLTSLIDGKPMARVGDLVVCPRCKGVFRIKTGTDNMRDEDGNGYARHLDITDCGAHLIASQATAAGRTNHRWVIRLSTPKPRRWMLHPGWRSPPARASASPACARPPTSAVPP